MKLYRQLLTNNDCYKAGRALTVTGLMLHSTGANNKRLSRYVQPDDGRLGGNTAGTHWNQPRPGGRQVCVHAFIGTLPDGTVATYQTLPWTMRGWHAGGTANNNYIGIEMCEDNLVDNEYFNAAYKEAVEVFAYLCRMFDLNPLKDGVVICHSEGSKRGIASNHADVMHWFRKHEKTMDMFRKDVNAELGNSNAAAPGQSNTQDDADVTYVVQVGAFSVKANAEAMLERLAKAGFDGFITTKAEVVDKSSGIKLGDVVRVKEGAKTYTGGKVSDFVYNNTYTVDALKGDRAVLGLDSIITPFNVKDLEKVGPT